MVKNVISAKKCQDSRLNKTQLNPVRRPYPDRNREGFHYGHLKDTPANDRTVDDFQPRAQLRKLFNKGNMDTDKQDKNI